MSATPISSISEGAYWIRSKADGHVLGAGAPVSDGTIPLSVKAQLSAHQAMADVSQMWLVEPLSDGVRFSIRNAKSANVLDVKGGITDDGTSIIVYTQTNNDNQHWTFEWVSDADGSSYYRINNVFTKKVMTLNDDVAESAAWNNADQQLWAFDPVVFAPLYWISHAKTGWYLQYDKAKDSVIVDDKISSTEDTRSQLWFLDAEPEGDAYVIGSIEKDDRVLDLSGSSSAEGAPILAFTYHGGKNQQWLVADLDASNPNEDRVKIVSLLTSAVIEVKEGTTSGTLEAQTDHGNTSQTWRLHEFPSPPIYWSTIQNLQTGKFLKQDGDRVTPSSGMANSLDYSVQWRFVPDAKQPHHYSIINRATGKVLSGKSLPPTVNPSQNGQGTLWALELAGDGIAIVNTTTIGALDHFAGGPTIEAYPHNGIDSTYHHWIPVQVSDRLPSFALVNSRTGRSLALKSSKDKGGVVMSPDTVDDWSNQWYFENLSGTNSDSPEYAIINKVSGTVLDHYGGSSIEALNDDTGDKHHRWKLIPCPCGENYFQIKNVSTGHYLEERVDNVPNANATDPMNHDNPTDTDRAQCWEIVSGRMQDIDLVVMDDDVMQAELPYLQSGDAETLRHRIVERAPGKEKKGKDKDAHKPQNPRLLRDIAPDILAIFHHVIDEWAEDTLPSTVQAGTRVSTTRREVERRWRIMLPRGLLAGSDRDGWIRIDIQGTYETAPGQRVANIQGQWNNESVFHVIVPLAVRVGREVIREGMRRSLRDHTSVTIAQANSKLPSGGKKPGNTPKPPPPPPQGPSGNGWVYYAAAIFAIILLSPIGA